MQKFLVAVEINGWVPINADTYEEAYEEVCELTVQELFDEMTLRSTSHPYNKQPWEN